MVLQFQDEQEAEVVHRLDQDMQIRSPTAPSINALPAKTTMSTSRRDPIREMRRDRRRLQRSTGCSVAFFLGLLTAILLSIQRTSTTESSTTSIDPGSLHLLLFTDAFVVPRRQTHLSQPSSSILSRSPSSILASRRRSPIERRRAAARASSSTLSSSPVVEESEAGSEEQLSPLQSSSAPSPPTEDSRLPTLTISPLKDDHRFDMSTALFCAGLAFDSYVEPSPTSSRWERGSRGMNVAFLSQEFTKSLYKGLVEVTPLQASDLPDEVKETKLSRRPDDDSNDGKSSTIGVVESLATGDGVDACILCAAVESNGVPEDLDVLKQKRHAGVWELSGAAHVGRTETAWSNVREPKSKQAAKRDGKALPYHVPSGWGRPAKAIWPESTNDGTAQADSNSKSRNVIPGNHDFRYYVYVQDPSTVRLLFTLQDDDVIGNGTPISSTSIQLSKYLPQVKYTQEELIEKVKSQVMAKIRSGELNDPTTIALLTGSGDDDVKLPSKMALDDHIMTLLSQNLGNWEGDLKLDVAPPRASKNDQMALGAAAGAWLAGPVGAAAGAAVGLLYDGPPRGVLKVRMRYLPIISAPSRQKERYEVYGGMPGIFWGDVYEQYLRQQLEGPGSGEGDRATTPTASTTNEHPVLKLGGDDLEHCFFINHDKTGASCAVYRSLEQHLICVSFRGTCQPIDLVTDASIFQEPWVESPEYTEEELSSNSLPKVHVGFRRSMNSISRRLKELILATVAEGENLSQYDVLVTGHSLGGALATLFVADVAEFGFDAGRALPQKEPSDEWWRAIANTFMGQQAADDGGQQKFDVEPPRPKSLRMYNFGSPRVGNPAFADAFELLIEQGRIDKAYRVVNSQDVVARVPRPMLGIDYEHCGRTVLIEEPILDEAIEGIEDIEEAGIDPDPAHVLWVEGESDFIRVDPVRDVRNVTKGIMSKGSLFDELYQAYNQGTKTEGGELSDVDVVDEVVLAAAADPASGSVDESGKDTSSPTKGGGGGGIDAFDSLTSSPQLLKQFSSMATRLSQMTMSDLGSVIGLDRSYTDRELQIARSVLKGEALAHHMEDSYYAAMRRAIGMKVEEDETTEPKS